MHEVLNRRGLERIQAIVVRYFGGIKLGAGGLVRAYSGTVAKALEQATFSEVKPHIRLSFHIPFTLMDSVHRFLADRSLAAKDIDYDAEGMFFSLELLLGLERAFELSLSDLTRGQAILSQRTTSVGLMFIFLNSAFLSYGWKVLGRLRIWRDMMKLKPIA
ncbi:MAG: YigZ family protein [Deinococcales bacterium]